MATATSSFTPYSAEKTRQIMNAANEEVLRAEVFDWMKTDFRGYVGFRMTMEASMKALNIAPDSSDAKQFFDRAFKHFADWKLTPPAAVPQPLGRKM